MNVRRYYQISKELFYLTDKIANLDMFIDTDPWKELSEEQCNLLLRQIDIMRKYAAILVNRLHVVDECSIVR